MHRIRFTLGIFLFLVGSSFGEVPHKVLVTGASGFVGGNVVSDLLARDVAVRVLVRDANKLDPAVRERVEVVIGDLEQLEVLRQAVRGVDAIVHTAAFVADYALDASLYQRTNVDGTRALAQAAIEESHRHRVRFVYFSTVDVLEFLPGKTVDDNSPLLTQSPYLYPQTKMLAEKEVFSLFAQEREKGNAAFELTAVRPTWIYGPGDRNFLPGLIEALKAGTPVRIWGGDELHLSYIGNLTEVVWLLLKEPAAVGKTFISDDGPKPWSWIEETVLEHLHLKAPFIRSIPYVCASALASFSQWNAYRMKSAKRPDLTPYVLSYMFTNLHYSAARLREELGYTPSISTEEGFRRTLLQR